MMPKYNTRHQTRLIKAEEETATGNSNFKQLPSSATCHTNIHVKQEDPFDLDYGINGNEVLLWDVYKEHNVMGLLETLHQGQLEKPALVPIPPDLDDLTFDDPLEEDLLMVRDPFLGGNVDYRRDGEDQPSWLAHADGVLGDVSNLGQDSQLAPLPPYLMAGALGSPIPNYEYPDVGTDGPSGSNVKVKSGYERKVDENDDKDGFRTEHQQAPQQSRIPSPPKIMATPPPLRRSARKPRTSTSKPLVDRIKRHSDEDESLDSIASEFTDGSDMSDGSNSPHLPVKAASPHVAPAIPSDMPSLPRIPTVSVTEQTSKRQRRDVSMSAPAVAARELRLKKKAREEQLIRECNQLKEEAELMERETRESRRQLDKLREDAAYLRSLVKSQQTTVDLLQYLQNAPFFKGRDQGLHLDSGNMLRQISGDKAETVDHPERRSKEKEIGGICLHINGSNITLHLCSHCSSEASAR